MTRAVQNTRELARILAIPRREPVDDLDLTERLSALLRRPGGTQTLRPVQARALYEAARCRGLFGPIRVGGGKTLLTFLVAIVLRAKRPILFLPAKLVDKTRRELVTLSAHWKIPTFLRIESYEMLSRVQHARLLERFRPDLIIADECFSGDTLIATPHGPRPIASISAGDLIYSWDGRLSVQRVIQAWSREAKTLDLVFGSHKVTTTETHPFLTARGWVNAGELQHGERVCLVRPTHENESESLLLASMFGEISRTQPFDFGGADPRFGHYGFERAPSATDARTKSNVDAWSAPESLGNAQGTWTPADHSRREREASVSTSRDSFAGIESLVWRLLDRGLFCEDWLEASTPASLLDRLRASNLDGGDRSGRGIPRDDSTSGIGPAQGYVSSITRMATLTDVERSSAGFGKVYNLEVSGPHTYLVGPGLVVHNCHKLRHRKTAVTKRVERYLKEHPEVMFVGLSGTITKRSILDYEHIIRWCLKPLACPVPNNHGEIEDWADCLDEHNRERVDPGALAVWTNGDPTLSVVRAAFRSRLVETPGVVSTVDSRVACSLVIRAARYECNTEAAFARLRDLWETPNGEPLTDGMSVWRHARELALGFFYRWLTPAPSDWLEARREWASMCRKILSSNQRRLDSELAVIHAVDEGHYPIANGPLKAWREIKKSFEPETVPEWLCTKAVDHAAEWSRTHTGIVWTEHVAFAKKLAQATNLRYYGRGGVDEQDRPIEAHPADWSMIASIASNAEGRNLQAWSRGLVTSCPPNGSQVEQLLGRMHRDGQEADEVTYDVMLGCAEHVDAFWRSFRDAWYVQETTGAEQKLLLASIDIPPEIREDGANWNR